MLEAPSFDFEGDADFEGGEVSHVALTKGAPAPATGPAKEVCAAIDFETKSELDVTEVGAVLYARDPSTRIMFLSYALPWFRPNEVIQWQAAFPGAGMLESPPELLEPLFEFIRGGGLLEAHNSFFEEMIWRYVMKRHFKKFPKVANEKWRDTAARAACVSLPRDLKGACEALNLPVQKDAAGRAYIRKYSQPKRLTKKEKNLFGEDAIIWNEDLEGLMGYAEYNKQDVRAQRRLSISIPDLSPRELRIWQITQDMNRRGVLIDVELCRAAVKLTKAATNKLNAELESLTGIEKGSQRKQVKEWLEENEGCFLADTTAKTLEWYLERFDPDKTKLTPRCRRVLEIVREVNRTSPKKYNKMLLSVDEDDRAYELLSYCGAERTGRWAGRGIQVQNLPKGNFTRGSYNIDDAVRDIKQAARVGQKDREGKEVECDLAYMELVWGDVMGVIVSCLRGVIIAPTGRELITADYSAIEARCVLWLAGAVGALKVFARDPETGKEGDIYLHMASGIFNRKITKANARIITTDGKTERDFGKVAILGLGYGMGWIKFLLTLREYKIYLTRDAVKEMMGLSRLQKYEAIVRKKLFPQAADFIGKQDAQRKLAAAQREAKIELRRLSDGREDAKLIMHELALCKYTVEVYRSRYEEVPAMWKAQESAAIEAIRTRKPVKCGMVTWFIQGRFLKCRLPSGRCLHYCDPELKTAKTAWGESRPSIRFMGKDQKTKQWTRQGTYGGKLTENITQATARDIMAIAMIGLDDHLDYDLLITVHDEAVTEVDDGRAVPEEFERMMTAMPAAFNGCPITAESVRYKRYRKA